MNLKEIIEEVKEVEFDTVRVESEDYFEGVMLRDKLPKLTERLNKIFGEPLMPSDKEIPGDALDVINDSGGIRDDQTLYFLKDGKYRFFAMLWPWTDEYHTTVKIGCR